MQNLSKTIIKLRQEAGLSITELADRSDLSSAYISKLENGAYKTLSLVTCRQLADGLNLSLKYFLEKIGFLSKERPSYKLIGQAFRSNGYTSEQAAEVERYARYIKKNKI